MNSPIILEMNNITKEFPGVKALDRVNLKIHTGEIHALVGENGAGKSTLMKILSGVYPAGTFQGEIIINGHPHRFHSIHEAEKAGIAIIYQELTLIKEMSIGENIFLGKEPLNHGFIDTYRLNYESQKYMEQVKLNLNVSRKIKEIGVGQQQLIEIAKALSKKARILVLDEPTAALTESESNNLFTILQELKNQGVTCIYISHRLNEVFRIADRVTILRDGQTVGTAATQDLTENEIITMMVGRKLTELFPREPHESGDVILSVENLSVEDPARPGQLLLENVSFEVRQGEILGIAGLMGAGRTELVTSIFGAYPGRIQSGVIKLNGKKIKIRSPLDAIQHGLGLVTEDRKRYGLVLNMKVMENLTLAGLKQFSQLLINQNEEIKMSNSFVDKLRIKTPSLESKTNNLSGGNQQKVVLGKWLLNRPKVLFLDEPTRGIDVGAKVEIYKIMNQLIREGVAVVMVSSELPEILGMSDRILVMCQGKITGELQGAGAEQEQVMRYATGGR